MFKSICKRAIGLVSTQAITWGRDVFRRSLSVMMLLIIASVMLNLAAPGAARADPIDVAVSLSDYDIAVGETTVMTIMLTNNTGADSLQITIGTGYGQNNYLYPTGIIAANPTILADDCGSLYDEHYVSPYEAGDLGFYVPAATLAAGASCTIQLTLKGTVAGVFAMPEVSLYSVPGFVHGLGALPGDLTVTAAPIPDPTPTLTFNQEVTTARFGTDFSLAATSTVDGPGAGAITYSSSDSNIADVVPDTGYVTALAVGEVTITALQAAAAGVNAEATATMTFTVEPRTPTVTGLSVSSGPQAGGTTVVLTGTNLDIITEVHFGATVVSVVTVNSATEIVVTSPAGAEGAVNVTVVTPYGTSAATAGNLFTYDPLPPPPPAPTITGLSPSSGTTAGGTIVEITGTGFSVGYGDLKFGVGLNVTPYEIISDTLIRAETISGPAGVVDVTLTTENGTSVTNPGAQFTYADPAPVLTFATPTSASVATGGSLTNAATSTITGGGAGAITYSSSDTNVAMVNSTTGAITTIAVGTATITATQAAAAGVNAQGTQTYLLTVTYPAATVTGLNPTSGPVAGGTTVTITGSGFLNTTGVKFGTIDAVDLTIVSDTQIRATSAAGTGIVDVIVTAAGGANVADANSKFTYVIPDPTPVLTFATPTAVSISLGNYMSNPATSTIASAGAGAITYASSNTSVATVNTTTGDITAVALGTATITATQAAGSTVNSTASQTYAVTVAYLAPTVTALSPASGSAAGGNSVMVTGSNFYGLSAVRFGDTNALHYTYVGDALIQAFAPPGVGAVNVTVTTPGGTSAVDAGNLYTYVPTPVLSFATPTSAEVAYGGSLTNAATSTISGGGAGAISYSSSNGIVATVNATTGAVTPVGVGTATITATQVAAPGVNASATKTYALSVTPGTGSSSSLNWSPYDLLVVAGATKDITITATNNTGMDLAPSDGSRIVVELSGPSGQTILDAGAVSNTCDGDLSVDALTTKSLTSIALANGASCTVVYRLTAVSGSADATFVAAQVALVRDSSEFLYFQMQGFSLSIDPPAPVLTFATPTSASVALGDSLTNAATSSISGEGAGAITYSSSDTNVATVNASTGAITTVGVGSTTITATQAAAEGVNQGATQTYALTVTAPTPVLGVTLTHTGSAYRGSTFTYVITPSATVANTSGTLTATWSLPPGLTFSDATGTGWSCPSSGCTSTTAITAGSNGNPITLTVSVDPNATSPQTPSITLTGGGATSSATANDSGTTIVTPAAPTITVGTTTFPTTIAVGGTTQLTFTLTNPNPALITGVSASLFLPSGLVINQNSGGQFVNNCTNGTLSGTTGGTPVSLSGARINANSSCTFTVVVRGASIGSKTVPTGTPRASGASVGTAGSPLTITVNAAVSTTQAIPSTVLVQGVAVTPFTPVTGSGGAATLIYSISPGGSLPSGLSFDTASGQISGTPAAARSLTTYTVTVFDGPGVSAPSSSKTFDLTVNAPPTPVLTFAIPTAASLLVGGSVTNAASSTLSDGSYGAISYSSSDTDIATVNAFGVITPLAPGAVTITATQAAVSGVNTLATQTYNLTVGAAVTVSQAVASITLTQNSATGLPFTPATAWGGNGTLSFALYDAANSATASLPAGLNFLTSSGQVTGTPTATQGATTYTVRVTDQSTVPTTATATFALTVNAPAPTVTALSPATGPATGGTIVTLTGTNFTGATVVTFGSTAATGLTINSASSITATAPAGNGTVEVTVTAPGGISATTGEGNDFTYVAAPTAAAVNANVAYNSMGQAVTLLPSGAFTSLAVGTAPANGSVTISGTTATYIPTTGYFGPDSFTYTASGPGGTSSPATVSVTVANPDAPTVSSTSASVAYNASGQDIALTASGVFTGLSVATAPAHGSVTITGQTATYIPTTGYYGADSFTVTATGPGGTSSPATVSVTVANPDAPTVSSTSASVAYNASGQDIVLTASGVFTGLSVATAPAHGSVTITGQTATYIPTTGYYGADSFTVTATGPGGTSSPATVSVTVANPDAPTVSSTSASVAYNASGQDIALTASGVFTGLSVATAPAHGSVTITGQTATYIPTTGYYGADSFTVTATGPGGTSSPSTVSVTVAIPDAPTVSSTSASVAYNASGQDIALTASGVFTGLSVATPPAHGAVTITGQTATYIPTTGYYGADSFTVTASGPGGTSSPATVSVTVATPPPPQASAVATSVEVSAGAEGGSTPIDLTSAVRYASGIEIITPPLHGTVTVSGFTVTYRPNTGYFGPDSFVYRALGLPGSEANAGISAPSGSTAGGALRIPAASPKGSAAPGASSPAEVSITVMPPTLTMSPSTASSATVGVAFSQAFSASGGTAPYHDYRVAAGNLPAGMTLSADGQLSGTPTAGGTFNFTIAATDSSTGGGPFMASKAYSLAVGVPTVSFSPGSLSDGFQGVAYGPVSLLGSGGTAPYSFELSAGSLPTGTTLSSAGILSGTPTQSGAFTFTVRVTDASTGSGPFIGERALSLNIGIPSAPTAAAAELDSSYNSAGAEIDVAALVSGAYTGVALATGPTHGSVVRSGTRFTYVPTAGYYGPDSFSYTATGYGGASAPAVVSVNVAAPAPVTTPKAASTSANASVDIAVTTGDSGPITSIAIVQAPSQGVAVINGLVVTYTPTTNYFGVDSFSYTATGMGGTSAPTVVSLTVRALPVPTSPSRTAIVLSGQSVILDASSGATGGPFTAVSLTGSPSAGTASVSGQQISYIAPAGFSGTASFTYTLSNAYGTSAPITVTVTVNPMPAPAAPITVTVPADGSGSAVVTANATGGPFRSAAIVSLSPAQSGMVSISEGSGPSGPTFTLTFTATAHFSGPATVTYTLTNAFATSAPGTVVFQVQARPDPTLDPDVRSLVTAQADTAVRFATTQMANFNQRLESMRNGPGRSDPTGVNLNFGDLFYRGDQSDPFALRDRQLGRQDADVAPWGVRPARPVNPAGGIRAAAGPAAEPDGAGGASIWTGGAIDLGLRRSRAGLSKLDFTTQGVSLGADVSLGDRWVIGGGAGYASDSTRIGTSGSRSKATSYVSVLYGAYHPSDRTYLEMVLGYGDMSFESRRYVSVNGLFAYGKRDGSQLFGSVTAAFAQRSGALTWTPYGRVTMVSAKLDSFTEAGGGVGALTFFRQDIRSMKGIAGLTSDYTTPTRYGVLTPALRLEYAYEFEDKGTYTLSYADWIGGPVYSGRSDALDRGRLTIGVGADLQRGPLLLGVEYRGAVGSDEATSNQVTAKASLKF